MSNCTTTPLSEVKFFDPLCLLRDVMNDVGPAAQTAAAMRRLASKSATTFASQRVIAEEACLSPRTVEKHLAILCERNWISKHGRQRRRTPTYIVTPELLNRDDSLPYAMLPRWAAKMLPSWKERAVFACIISRHSLLDTTGDGDGQNFGRAAYPVKTLHKDTGLWPQAIADAKALLARRGVIEVFGPMWDQDERGRCITYAADLRINPDFPVRDELLHRRTKMGDCTVSDKGSATITETLKVGDTTNDSGGHQYESGGRGVMNLGDTQYESGGCSEEKSLKEPLKRSLDRSNERTAEPLVAVSAVFVSEGGGGGIQEEEQGNEDQSSEPVIDLSSIDFEERKRKLAEQCQALKDSDLAGRGIGIPF